MSGLCGVVDDADVVLCCGTGGVGKTTTAAAMALAAAERGRRAVVVTIDPARRLADALGLNGDIGNDCVPVAVDGPGELWVTMLDTKATFDRLIDRHAHDAGQASRILDNRYYRNLSTSLSGTREFMAMERLYELHTDDRFDMVVVDTPPSRNALDFLEAPDRLARFLDGRLFRLAAPGGRITRRLTAPLLVFMRRIARVVSPEVVDDTLAFIEAFGGMEEGFRERADAVDALMSHAGTGFVLVTTAMAEAVEESRYFATKLGEADIAVAGLVVNRLQPTFTGIDAATVDRSGLTPGLTKQLEVLTELQAIAAAETDELAPLLADCASAQVAMVEQFDHDVHDLDGIRRIVDAICPTD